MKTNINDTCWGKHVTQSPEETGKNREAKEFSKELAYVSPTPQGECPDHADRHEYPEKPGCALSNDGRSSTSRRLITCEYVHPEHQHFRLLPAYGTK